MMVMMARVVVVVGGARGGGSGWRGDDGDDDDGGGCSCGRSGGVAGFLCVCLFVSRCACCKAICGCSLFFLLLIPIVTTGLLCVDCSWTAT